MKSVSLLKLFAFIAAFAAGTLAHAECSTDLGRITEIFNSNRAEDQQISALSSRWVQGNSPDGKPISISIREEGSGLFVTFSQEGNVLGQGHVRICSTNNNSQFVVQPIGQLTPGAEAPPELSSALTDTRAQIRFTLQNSSSLTVRVSGPFGPFGIQAGQNFSFNSH